MPKVNKNNKTEKTQKGMQKSLATDQEKCPKNSKWKVRFAPTSQKTQPSDVKVNKCKRKDILDDYEVMIEQPGQANKKVSPVREPQPLLRNKESKTSPSKKQRKVSSVREPHPLLPGTPEVPPPHVPQPREVEKTASDASGPTRMDLVEDDAVSPPPLGVNPLVLAPSTGVITVDELAPDSVIIDASIELLGFPPGTSFSAECSTLQAFPPGPSTSSARPDLIANVSEVNKNNKTKKSQKRVQASLEMEHGHSSKYLKCSRKDNLEDYEVVIEQPDHANNEEPEVFMPDNMVQFNGDEPLTDPISLNVKTEPRDDKVTLLVIRQIEEMPRGHALETPLHPKKRRMWRPQSPDAPVPSSPGGDGEVASTSSAMEVGHTPQPSDASPSKTHKVPSPAAYLDCSQAITPSASPSKKRSRRSPDSPRVSRSNLVNCGSDHDSDASGDEDEEDSALPMMTARAFRKMISLWVQDDGEVDKEDVADDAVPEPATDAVPFPPHPVPLADPTLRATDQPWCLYDFNWRPFPTTPIAPELRREPFSQIDVGPTIPYVDPYDIFVAIWDRQFMEYIASESNRYAQQVVSHMINNHTLSPQSRIGQWTDTTADELYVFFGIILAMGVVVKTRVAEYWSSSLDIFCTPGFSAHMSMNRFVLLIRCLHFVNNEDVCQLALEGSEARLFKIKPLLSHLNTKFQDLYILSQNLALDESLLMWKGCLDIGQLIPNKVANRGIKTYELCESRTGYLWRFEVHAHSKSTTSLPQSQNPMEKSTPAIVLRLIQGLEQKGYTLWMDNFYNSPCLARRLKCLGFDCVGTLRTNRQFVPESLRNLTKQEMRRGEISGLTAGDIDIMVWRDCGRVGMISTYHGDAVQTTRGATKPILIHDYNIMMGGVDKKDQMLAMYPVERKRTKIWYKKLFRRLLNISVLNSLIIHRHNSPSSSRLTHRDFRISLIRSLLSRHCSASPILRPPKRQTFDISHRVAMNPVGRSQRMRRLCVMCKKKTGTFCVGCDKAVCLDPCFVFLHS